MTSRAVHRIIIAFIFQLSTLLSVAQSRTEVSARVDRDSILIGEPIELILEADIPENAPIRFFPVDTIPHFEFLDRGMIDTTNTSEGTFLRRVMRITSFDSGRWVIPALSIGGGIQTDSIEIAVGFSEFDRNQDYHDIKDILEADPEEEGQPWWFYAIGALIVALIVLYILYLRRKKPVVQQEVQEVDAYNEAMEELAGLEASSLAEKVYYSKLVDIFRLYVHRRKGIESLQKTTDDLVVRLRGIGISQPVFARLAAALRLSDFVKFAKYIPVAEDDREAFSAVKAAIEEIEMIK